MANEQKFRAGKSSDFWPMPSDSLMASCNVSMNNKNAWASPILPDDAAYFETVTDFEDPQDLDEPVTPLNSDLPPMSPNLPPVDEDAPSKPKDAGKRCQIVNGSEDDAAIKNKVKIGEERPLDACNIIYSTTDYDRFKTALGNRLVDERHVAELEEKIAREGWVGAPIIVNTEGEVIDGQHRLAACRRIGVAVQYCIDANADRSTCALLNSTQKKWGATDYIRHFIDCGSEDYKKLDKLNAFCPIGHSYIAELCMERNRIKSVAGKRRTLTSVLHNGEFVFDADESKVFKILRYVKDCLATSALKGRRISTFFSVLVFIYEDERIDHVAFLHRLRNYPQKCLPFSTKEECLKSFDDLYVHMMREDKRVSVKALYDERHRGGKK